MTVLDYADPTGEIDRAEEQAALQREQIDDAMIIGAVLIVIALIVFMAAKN